MDLNNVYAFYFVAKHQNFSKAAEELYISQGGVSLRIKRLEEELGIELITRSSRRMELTEAGKLLFHQVESFMENVPHIVHMVERLKSNNGKSHVVIGMHHKFGEEFIRPYFSDFKQSFDHVRVYYDTRDNLFRALKEERIDFIVSTTPYRPPMELTIEKVGEVEIVLIAKESLAQLKEYELLWVEATTLTAESVEQVAKHLERCPWKISSVSGNVEVYYDSVTSGKSAMISQRNNVEKLIESGKVKLVTPIETLDIHLFYLPKYQQSETILKSTQILSAR